MRRNKKPVPPKPPSNDDLFADELREAVARSIARALKASVNLERPIRTLTLAEMKVLAEAATSTWIVLASKRIAECEELELTDEEADRLSYLLM
jgi:hypothetical protein